jgi:sigma-54 dependent transcriptional regulator, acetoin dehydrogenase operon transcriptional activator AcoR
VLYEKSDRLLKETLRHRAGEPFPCTAGNDADTLILEVTARAARESLTLEDLAGEDPQMLRNVRSAYRIADSNVSVLIQGPTGSGKEAFAHAIHVASQRASRPFVAVNCAAIPETLIESELFGYKPGAFTGARREGMRGKILQSSGGTLFLDEIGDMPIALQSRLLRVLEEQQIVPLGSESAIKVDLHVIAASHRNLREMIARATFREDLYYRLNGITLELPALRQRADKERLVHQALAAETGSGRPAAIERDALQRLLEYPWPGNIRELRNVIRTALAICEGGVVRRSDLPREIRDAEEAMTSTSGEADGDDGSEAPTLANPLQAAERAALLRVIDACRGNMTRVALQLGMSRNTLYRRVKRYGISLVRRGARDLPVV